MATDPASERKERFDQAIAEVDEKQLARAVDFAQHRFVSVERDKLTNHKYLKGFKSLRGACNHLARVTEEGEPFVPENILDLDTGELHELDLFAFVAPRSMDAVAVMFPKAIAQHVVATIASRGDGAAEDQTSLKLIKQAIDRRK